MVNLLTHGLRAPAAASATLLDLAASRLVEVIEVGEGRGNTLVRLRKVSDEGLTPYEERVLSRLRRFGPDTAVPVAELTTRYAEGNYRWHQRLSHEVRVDAHKRGLTRRTATRIWWAAALTALVMVGQTLPCHPDKFLVGNEIVPSVIAILIIAMLATPVLALIALPFIRERDRLTERGRQVVAHWLGVAAWLQAHEPLRDLPPAAVAVWDRYLAYGAALGVMPHAVGVLDLETTGRRDVVWSTHTGIRRPVRVGYHRRNRFLRPVGPVGARLTLIWALISLPLWTVVAIAFWDTQSWVREVVAGLATVQAATTL